jgi:hypothetical protein
MPRPGIPRPTAAIPSASPARAIDAARRYGIPLWASLADLEAIGVMIVMSDGIIDPSITRSAALDQAAMSFFGYSESGEFSRKLSERIVLMQTQRAAEGYSTGERPPYGFGRFLCDARRPCGRPGSTARLRLGPRLP